MADLKLAVSPIFHLRGDQTVRLEQVARVVQKHGDEVDVRCSGW